MKEIDAQLWNLYKHLGMQVDLDIIPVTNLAQYILEHMPTGMTMEQVTDRIIQVRKNRQALKHLQTLPQVAQRSPEWYELRRNRLTASDMAQAMGRGKFGNRSQLLKKKAFPEDAPLNMNSEPLRWGVMFEPIASRSYSQRLNDMLIHDFGLIPHSSIECFGASPDGITELGVMVEFKCPWRRKIDGNVLEQYEIQMQGQMAVCELDECHFVECDIQKLENEMDYLSTIEPASKVDHGIVIEYPSSYEYSPPYLTPSEAVAWATLQPVGKCVYWKLRKYHQCSVFFDKKRWDEMVPHVMQFWEEVESMRKTQSPVKKNKIGFIEDDDDNDFT